MAVHAKKKVRREVSSRGQLYRERALPHTKACAFFLQSAGAAALLERFQHAVEREAARPSGAAGIPFDLAVCVTLLQQSDKG